ncbi:MAG: hypothetical protein ACFFCD_06480 [Promethearchaeota archaeon]
MAEKLTPKIDRIIDTLQSLISQLQEIRGIIIGFGMASETIQAGIRTTETTRTAPPPRVEEAPPPSPRKVVEVPEPPQEWGARLKYDEVSELFDKPIDIVMESRNYAEATNALEDLRDNIESSGIMKTFHPAMYEINSEIRKYKAMGTDQISQEEKETIANDIREWKVRFLK